MSGVHVLGTTPDDEENKVCTGRWESHRSGLHSGHGHMERDVLTLMIPHARTPQRGHQVNEASQKETKTASSLGWLSRSGGIVSQQERLCWGYAETAGQLCTQSWRGLGVVISLQSLFPADLHLAPALFFVISPWASLVVQEWADQGRGLLVVRTQVGRQGHIGGGSSSLRVD